MVSFTLSNQLIKTIYKICILISIIILGYIILTFIYNHGYKSQTSADKFADIILNDVTTNDISDADILRQYGCYFNNETKQNLMTGASMANKNYIANSANIALKLNTLSKNIDTLMVKLNNDILNNISENYGRAHLLNRQREEMKKTIDELPLKNI